MKIILAIVLILVSVSIFSSSCTKNVPVTTTVIDTLTIKDTLSIRDTLTIKDTITIIDTINNCNRFIIQPSNNLNEVFFSSNNPLSNQIGDTDIWVGAWTINGSQVNGRIALKFDLSGIPNTALIDSAKLFLYASPVPDVGDKVNSDYGTADACYIQRITANWSPASIDWDNPPTTTSTDEAIIPQSTSSFQNDVIDVSALLNDIETSGNNYGFAIQMQSETFYNIRQYASSYYSNSALRPKLVVSYHLK